MKSSSGLIVAMFFMICGSEPARASLSNCTNIYVISLSFTMADPRPRAVFAESPSAITGSALTYPTTGYPERAYEQLYATLLSAKLSNRAVSITTSATDQCSITSGSQYLASVEVSPGL